MLLCLQFTVVINIDEAGCDTQGKKFTKRFMMRKGSDSSYVQVAAEQGKHVTVVASVCSDGTAVPPTVILTGSNTSRSHDLLVEYEAATTVEFTKSGWTNTEIFLNVLKTVVKHVSGRYPDWAEEDPLERRPVLIVLDGHSSHTAPDAVVYCVDNGLRLVRSPAHCTHVVQVLDSHQLFGAFQTKLRNNLATAAASGVITTQVNFGRYFTEVWDDVFGDSRRIKRMFREYGLVPFNPKVLDMTKVRNQKALRDHYDRQKLVMSGMTPEEAAAAIRDSDGATTCMYDERWANELKEHFDIKISIDDEDKATKIRQLLVHHAIMQQQNSQQNPTEALTMAELVSRKRRNKACGQQAAHLTSEECINAARETIKRLEVQAVDDAEEAEYEAVNGLARQVAIAKNKENDGRRAAARTSLNSRKRALKEAVDMLKAAKKQTSKVSWSVCQCRTELTPECPLYRVGGQEMVVQ